MLANNIFKKSFILLNVLIVLLQPLTAYAQRGGPRDHHGPREYRAPHGERYHHYAEHPHWGMRINLIDEEYVPVIVSGILYYYRDGLYYVFSGGSYVLVAPPFGAVVRSIPLEYHPVVIHGVTYYENSGIFYLVTPAGYQVVPPPLDATVGRTITPNQTKVAEGSILGGLVGALLGGVIGHQQKGHNELRGALLGGAAGAIAGGVIGAQMPSESALSDNREKTVVTTMNEQPVSAAVSTPVQTMIAPVTGEPVIPAVEEFTVNIPNAQGGYVSVVIKRSGSGFIGPQGEYYAEFPKVAQLQAMYVQSQK